ncbi:phosphoglycan beta 1 3 galactosyltransferase (SCGR2) [Leptomonas seymouri]|uniref:Phosphoglycan beta 1 3 galactosyltransferase (SCGR2) n=1 Tax=Leptomonas seymouri TaxID=5684 RepID=A0A0N1I172_LEPSE|nr:phosphoglycan beta 1 3 galactosyltransferase (SCGR2) [Leptomonas seymouri]|eukprot:KPI82985.1 phosphoglycan beta 1 3 galactosyltransferase (SCGR2) [Leptomonas seymouri]
MSGFYFNAGMLFMVHRNMVRAVLEPPTLSMPPVDLPPVGDRGNAEHVLLAIAEYNVRLAATYYKAHFQHEDAMLGFLLRRSYVRMLDLCQNRTLLLRETFTRFHDLRVGRQHNVSWASVAVHRCRATDFHFLHFFFHQEHLLGAPPNADPVAVEAAAKSTLLAWVEQKNLEMPQYDTWNDTPSVSWQLQPRGTADVPHVVDPSDGVAVYMCRCEKLGLPQFQLYDGCIFDP